MKHAGYIQIDSKALGRILDFEDAVIWSARVDRFNVLEILIEHPDLPEVIEWKEIPILQIAHTATYGDNGVLLKLERTDPKKGEK